MKKCRASPWQKSLAETWHLLIKVHQKQDPSDALIKPDHSR
jgi:hypothetical protein